MEFIDQVIRELQNNADAAPFVIFGLLALSGFNLPVSEDILLFVSAGLAAGSPDLFWALFLSIHLGALCGDSICYWVGRLLGPRISQVRWFAQMVSQERMDRISEFYDRYGVATLIIGRFIPFGVRNGLLLTAGLGKMNYLRFALSDLVAVTLSTGTYFWLYYTYSEAVLHYVQRFHIVIFSLVSAGFILWVLRGWALKKRPSRDC